MEFVSESSPGEKAEKKVAFMGYHAPPWRFDPAKVRGVHWEEEDLLR